MEDNELTPFRGLTKPDVPLADAVVFYAAKKHNGDPYGAARSVLKLLQCGELIATGIPRDGVRSVIPVDAFATVVPDFAGTRSLNRIIFGFSRRPSSNRDAIELFGNLVWRNVCVNRDGLLKIAGVRAPRPAHVPGDRNRKVGVPPVKREEIKARMRRDLDAGMDLVGMKQDALAVHYECSRGTAVAALDEVIEGSRGSS